MVPLVEHAERALVARRRQQRQALVAAPAQR
jgi:hypothetical protein